MKFNIEEIKNYIDDNPEAKIIIGGDSQKFTKRNKKGKWFRFVTCVVVYAKDKNHIFYEVSKERNIDTNPGKPFNRMMQETYKVVDITLKLMDVLIDRDFEIHLDIATDSKWGSNCALSSATGYVWGLIGVEPICKPNSWVASTVSDHFVKKNKNVLRFK